MAEEKSQEINGKTTIADIARESNVSPATVSLVLRDKPGVGSSTRQRVLDTARTLGYIPPGKSSFDSPRVPSKRIGMIIRVLPGHGLATNQFYAPVISGIESVCRQNQSHLLYSNMLVDDANQPLEIPRLISAEEIDGLMMVGIDLIGDLRNHLIHKQIPIVLVDSYATGNPFDSVITDNIDGAQIATNFLIEKGHRQIAIVGSLPNAFPSIRERRLGYVNAMTAAGLDPIFIDSDLMADAAVESVEQALSQNRSFSAIFACNDAIAIDVTKKLNALGIRVPEEISIVGFDNIMLAQHVTPALTTIRVDKVGMGRQAAQLIFNRIEFPKASLVRTYIRPQLIERNSVALFDNRHSS